MALVTVQRSPTPSTTSSPCVSESGSGEDDRRSQPRSISESFLTVRGAALFLPRGNGSSPSSASRFAQLRSKHAGDLQQHLQTMFTVLRSEDNIKLAVRLESSQPQSTRYMVVVSTNGRQDTEESLVLGMDFSATDSSCSVGLVLPLWSDTLIHLDGDGGFSVSTDSRIHVFKPVSVQAMWSALQSLHKACEVARCHNYFPGSLFLTWVCYYQSQVCSDQPHINEWNVMQDVQSHRADSPVLFSDVPTEGARTERLIRTRLREIMMQKDLENVTSKEIRTELEAHMVCNLREFKEFIDNEMIVILGQMDSPTEIFDHVYLGSEWNASNLEELQNSGVQYILNVTREIDNFFPGVFEYHNIRVYDEEATDLLAYWNDTYKFITRAKRGAKCLVHCKMGVSRSASTVIAYAMKEYGWELERAFSYVKERRAVTKPNPSFMRQLEEYQGILLASKQRHNKLWRSHSDSDLSEHHEPLLKPAPQSHTLGRSDPRNQGNSPPAPSLEELLQPLPSGPAPSGPAPSGPAPSTVALLRAELSLPSAAPPAVPPPSPPLSNGLCDSEENLPALADPPASSSPPPSPRPPPLTEDVSTVTVASPAAVVQPHPPPSVHHLPPSPAPSPQPCGADDDEATEPTHTPEPPSPHSALPPGPPTPPPDCDQAQPPPGDPPSPPEGPPALSTDHINFFSAREKFQGLAQDGRSRGSSVQAALQPATPRGPGQDQLTQDQLTQDQLTQDGPAGEDEPREEGEETRKECVISAQHVVPECTGAQDVKSTPPSVTPPPGSSSQSGLRGQEAKGSKEEVEERTLDSAEEAEDVKEEVKNKAEPMDASPAPLSGDWTRGSVRRVTRQLEQRMKQEHDSPCPSSSPPPLGPACPQRRPPPPGDSSPPTAPPLPETDPQDAPLCPQGPGVSTVQEEEEEEDPGRCSPMEEVGDGTGGRAGRTHKPRLPEGGSSPPLFRPTLHSSHDPLSSVDFLCLEGVTGEESVTDWPPRGDAVARQTWETLRELGAFLQQVSRTQGGDRAWGGDGWPDGGGREGRCSRQRAREVEARIRQAGLTPPSLMKRSASLAKLGCLELLANDLSQWELSRPVPAAVKPLPHAVTDESSKKQRVHRPPSESPPSDSPPRTGPEHLPEDTPSEHSPPSNQSTPPGELPEPSPAPLLIPLAARQQYGRTHPLRRLKKRSVSALYHTM